MSARDRLARWLRLDPGRRVAELEQAVREQRSRLDRLRVALAEANRLARTANAAKEEARARADAAEKGADAASGLYGRQLAELDARVQQALGVLADGQASDEHARVVARELLDRPLNGGGGSDGA